VPNIAREGAILDAEFGRKAATATLSSTPLHIRPNGSE
jgi:hypothetical protein